MASIHGFERTGQAYHAGDLYSGVNNNLTRVLTYQNENIDPGWPCQIQSSGEIISSSSNTGNQMCATGDYLKRIPDASPKGWPCHFGGIIFTNRNNLSNPGDVIGNLMCLGSIDYVVNNKPGGYKGTSTVSLVLKRCPGKYQFPYGTRE